MKHGTHGTPKIFATSKASALPDKMKAAPCVGVPPSTSFWRVCVLCKCECCIWCVCVVCWVCCVCCVWVSVSVAYATNAQYLLEDLPKIWQTQREVHLRLALLQLCVVGLGCAQGMKSTNTTCKAETHRNRTHIRVHKHTHTHTRTNNTLSNKLKQTGGCCNFRSRCCWSSSRCRCRLCRSRGSFTCVCVSLCVLCLCGYVSG